MSENNNKKQSLGDRMKGYEREYEMLIPKKSYIVIRLDGHHFSKFTKQFRKPFDPIIKEAMIESSKELLTEFTGSTAYTVSDEITLIIPPVANEESNHPYNGRSQKLGSLCAGKVTSVFNLSVASNISQLGNEEKEKRILDSLKGCFFDARTFEIQDPSEVLNNIIWRQRDGERNSKSMYARKFFSHKQLQGLKSHEMIEKVTKEKNENWCDIEGHYKYGTILKKESYEKEKDLIRTRIVTISKKLNWSEENVNLVTAKKLNSVPTKEKIEQNNEKEIEK
ncbi:hypothetical protein M0813_28492 [Anaeramoeba flamelloides]|uniref:tRNAHis guanylyltransferase catalytic domain-containing protein n=1 Tax=Anaeramoeba flamelloides TaxID=1746091 RepID=A0ABQ8XTB0_9EUKA|nr:hypothetical protein M0813_28492 [Anaeramoeba flamelloides]